MTPVQREALTYWLITYGMTDVEVDDYRLALPATMRGGALTLMSDSYIVYGKNNKSRRIAQKAIDELNQGATE